MGDTDPEPIVGDINNYLEQFNSKDVDGSGASSDGGGGDVNGVQVISKTEILDTPAVALGSADATGTGQYFVDQTTGMNFSLLSFTVFFSTKKCYGSLKDCI